MILRLSSKRSRNEINIMKYLNIVELLYFVIMMWRFGVVSGCCEKNKRRAEYIFFHIEVIFHFWKITSHM